MSAVELGLNTICPTMFTFGEYSTPECRMSLTCGASERAMPRSASAARYLGRPSPLQRALSYSPYQLSVHQHTMTRGGSHSDISPHLPCHQDEINVGTMLASHQVFKQNSVEPANTSVEFKFEQRSESQDSVSTLQCLQKLHAMPIRYSDQQCSVQDCPCPETRRIQVPLAIPPLCFDLKLSPIEVADPRRQQVPGIGCPELASLLEGEHLESLILLDCRAILTYDFNHISEALNVSCGDCIRRKRLLSGIIGIVDLISGDEKGKETFRSKVSRSARVVVYDDNTRDIEALPATHPLKLVVKSMQQQTGQTVYFLHGGFQEFHRSYSFLCSEPEAPPNRPPLSSPTTPVLDAQIDSTIISNILPYLFIGNERDAADIACLTQNGITHVLNVTSHIPLHFEARSFTYKRLPASDNEKQNLSQYFDDAITFIDDAHTSGGKVLVHCQAGVSRSATIVIAYIMASTTLSMQDAFQFVKTCRSIVAPNFNFMGQLMGFEKTLEQRRATGHLISTSTCEQVTSTSGTNHVAATFATRDISTPGTIHMTSTPGTIHMTSTPGTIHMTSTPGTSHMTSTPGRTSHMSSTPGTSHMTSTPGTSHLTSTFVTTHTISTSGAGHMIITFGPERHALTASITEEAVQTGDQLGDVTGVKMECTDSEQSTA